MLKSELIEHSPLKILENTTHGGPGPGNLGAVVAPKGVGKTAFLVHLATYKLLQEKQVIHVSFSSRTDHINEWYEEIFTEVARRNDLDNAMEVHDETIKHRVIMNFNQSGVQVEQITRSLSAMIQEGHFSADLIIVDGFDFAGGNLEQIMVFNDFSRSMNLETWFSVSIPDPDHSDIFAPFSECFAVIITLMAGNGYVTIKLEKDHDIEDLPDLGLKLDPKILLISG